MAYRDRLRDIGAIVRESFVPTQPEQERLGDYRQRQLAEIKLNKTKENFNKLFEAAYDGEEEKFAAGWAFFETLWEQILEMFFHERKHFYDNFNDFLFFCESNGWRPEIHGSRRVLVKLAMYATLIKSPPPVIPKKGLVGELMSGFAKLMRMVGVDPAELREFVKEIIKTIV